MDWLAAAFGFKEKTRMVTAEGRLSHGEMEAGDGLIMLATPSPDYRGPKKHREECEQAAKRSSAPYIIDGVLVYVLDVPPHYEHARSPGARLPSEIDCDENAKRYRLEDLDGLRWTFVERCS